ncbi:LysR family transcriptional regulator [Hymenobacter sp. H14-R3]|uniref:winged helix-turn-helix domain-containing protein n=1 Tax=Hymenobacter sp. H14-R3 TaxID=3046308 RepID=UPI0024B8F553|nr:LysR family transcriptional regulator [Hymenobacter sp. H14-R3]MDJ0363851.1 LysR family transcriptional regulator [Hymenobacter sp. H14-R3]
MHELFAENQAFRAHGRLWIEGPADRFLGIGRLELLERIATTGSISRAAKEMGMSYKKAWDLVSSMNTQARQPLVSTQAGGAHGGGAALTEAGAQAVAEFRAMQARFEAFLADETARLYESK